MFVQGYHIVSGILGCFCCELYGYLERLVGVG